VIKKFYVLCWVSCAACAQTPVSCSPLAGDTEVAIRRCEFIPGRRRSGRLALSCAATP